MWCLKFQKSIKHIRLLLLLAFTSAMVLLSLKIRHNFITIMDMHQLAHMDLRNFSMNQSPPKVLSHFQKVHRKFMVETKDRKWSIEFVAEPNRTCGDGSTSVIVFVTSVPDHKRQRQAIRRTWANESMGKALVLFVLGSTQDQKLSKHLLKENRRTGDLLIGDFEDSYENLTVKSSMILLWVHNRCLSHIPMVMKTDEDVLVNLPALISFSEQWAHVSRTIFGRCWSFREVYRDRSNKWYVPYSVFKEDYWPRFCSGTGYLMTGDTVFQLLRNTHRVNFLYLEDVFFTGLVSQLANVSRQFRGEFMVYRRTVYHNCAARYFISYHRYASQTELDLLWRHLADAKQTNQCTPTAYNALATAEQYSPI